MDETAREVGRFSRQGLDRIVNSTITKKHFWPALLVTLALFILLILMFTGEGPGGADSWGHLAKAEYVAEQINNHGWKAFFEVAWLPKWYMGDPFRTYYPPLTTLLLTPLIVLTGSPVNAYLIFVALILILYCLFCYIFLYQQWGRWPAVLGTILAIWAPYQLRTIFFEGNIPRALSILGLPIIALATENLLTKPKRRVTWIALLAFSWLWVLLAHPQQAYLFAIGFIIFLIVRLFFDVIIPLGPAVMWLVSLGIGVMLAGAWILPAYSGQELSGVPFLPIEKVEIFSAPISGVFPAFDAWNGQILFGTGVIFLAILSVIARPDPRRNAWLVAGLLCIWLSLGPRGVFFSLLPLNEQLLPERFLNFSAFALAIAASGLFPMRNKNRLVRLVIVAGFIILDAYPSPVLVRGRPFASDQADLQDLVSISSSEDGRLALMTYPEPNALEVYHAGQEVDIINGWALENTPHNHVLRRVLSVPTWSAEYLERLFSMWNVRSVVVRGSRSQADPVRSALEEARFRAVEDVRHGYQIWIDPTPAAPVQIIPQKRMLALGDRLQPMFMAFPFAEESEVQKLSSLPPGSLHRYEFVALYRFEQSDFELPGSVNRIRSYLEAGGEVILDLSGMEETFGRALDFLDVDVLRLSTKTDPRVDWSEELEDLPEVLDLDAVAPQGWSGATYAGLDEVLARIEVNDKWYPFVGYLNVGEGRAWFVGFNIFYYAQLDGANVIVEALRNYVLQDLEISKDLRFQAVQTDDWEITSDGLSFTYSSETDLDEVLISYTYSPRWRVYIDGGEVPHTSYEHLIQVALPAGEHAVVVQYELFGTKWPGIGLGISVAALGMLVVIGFAERFLIRSGKLGQLEEDDVSQKEFSLCPNCTFNFAEVRSATYVTYPFKALWCPICDFRVDDDGYQGGADLSDEEKMTALDEWLKTYGYKLKSIEQTGSLTYEDYFTQQEEFFEKKLDDLSD